MSQIQQGPPAVPTMLSAVVARGKTWQGLMLVGAILLLVNFFTPWWSITVTRPDLPKAPKRPDFKSVNSGNYADYTKAQAEREKAMQDYQKAMTDYGKAIEKALKDLQKPMKEQARIMKENATWYRETGVRKLLDAKRDTDRKVSMDFDDDPDVRAMARAGIDPMMPGTNTKDEDEPPKEVTVRLWGWQVGTALMGFIFSFVIIAFVVVPWCVRVIRPWAWTGALAAAIMMVPTIILGLVWVIGSPGESAKPLMTQGMIIGPVICVLAALGTFAFSLAEGIGGLISLVKRKA